MPSIHNFFLGKKENKKHKHYSVDNRMLSYDLHSTQLINNAHRSIRQTGKKNRKYIEILYLICSLRCIALASKLLAHCTKQNCVIAQKSKAIKCVHQLSPLIPCLNSFSVSYPSPSPSCNDKVKPIIHYRAMTLKDIFTKDLLTIYRYIHYIAAAQVCI